MMIVFDDEEDILINPLRLVERIKDHFDGYCQRLKAGDQELREKFIRRFDQDVLRKMERVQSKSGGGEFVLEGIS